MFCVLHEFLEFYPVYKCVCVYILLYNCTWNSRYNCFKILCIMWMNLCYLDNRGSWWCCFWSTCFINSGSLVKITELRLPTFTLKISPNFPKFLWWKGKGFFKILRLLRSTLKLETVGRSVIRISFFMVREGHQLLLWASFLLRISHPVPTLWFDPNVYRPIRSLLFPEGYA